MKKLILFFIAASAFSRPLLQEVHGNDPTYGSNHIVLQSRTYTSITVTAGTDTFTVGTGHAFTNLDRVKFFAGTIPGGISSNTIYFVRNVAGNDFQVSTTAAGAIVNVTSAGATVNVYSEIATLRIAYDVDPARLTSGPIASSNDRGASGRVNWFDQTINRLPAATKIYIRIYATDTTGDANNTWGCNSGTGVVTEGSLTGLACEVGSDWPYFTTDVDPGPLYTSYPDGRYPKVATGATITYPSVGTLIEGDNLFTVATDCSDYESQKTAAVAANASKHVVFAIPSINEGNVDGCTPGDFPAKSGTFKMIVTSTEDELLLPPQGTRVQERHKDYLGALTGRLEVLVGGNGYHFRNLYLRLAPIIPSSPPVPIAISSSVRGTSATIWRFDLAAPHGLTSLNAQGLLHNVAFVSNSCQSGAAELTAIHDADSFSISCGTGTSISSTPDTTPGRYFMPVRAQRISALTLNSASCGGTDVLVEVDPSTVIGLGTGIILAVGDTVQGSPNSGMTGIVKSWAVTKVSDTSFCLDDSSGVSGTYIANSLSYSIDSQLRTISEFNAGNDDNWMDRVIFEGRQWPDKISTGLQLMANNSGVINSRFEHIAAWLAIDPATGIAHEYNTTDLNTTSLAIDCSFGQNKLISNNYIEGHGIMVFCQQGNGTAADNHAENIVVSHNDVYMSLKYMAGSAENLAGDNLYHPSRQPFELKRGKTVLFEHNKTFNNWVDFVRAGWSYVNTIRGNPATVKPSCLTQENNISDIVIRNNILNGHSGGMYLTNYDDSNCLATDTKRIAIENNLMYGTSWYTRVAIPSFEYGAAGWSPTPFATGASDSSLAAAVGVFVRNNTFHNPLGGGPNPMQMGRVTDMVVTNNLFTHNEFSAGGLATSTGSNGLPTVTTADPVTATRFSNLYGEIGMAGWQAPPRSRFRGNAVIRGTENNLQYATLDTACFASTTNNCNVSAAEMTTYYGSTSDAYFDNPSTNTTWSGTSPNARFAEMGFIKVPDVSTGDETADYRFKYTATPGQLASGSAVSYTRREVGMQWHKYWATSLEAYNVRVLPTSDTTATVAYSSRGTCTIQYSAAGFGMGTQVVGSSDTHTLAKTISLTGLSANTFYDYWLNCPREEFTGRFKTLP